MKALVKQTMNGIVETTRTPVEILKSKEGAIGYLFAWLLGVPATLLVVIYLLRGH